MLAAHSLGRIAWSTADGIIVLPVSYALVGERIVFRTSAGTKLAGLVDSQPVGFEIDDLDPETQTGWSVLVQGTSAPGDPAEGDEAHPWAPGDHRVIVAIEPSGYSGRVIAAS